MDADPATPSDEVLDLIGSIAMRRPARNEALRDLRQKLWPHPLLLLPNSALFKKMRRSL